MLFKKLDKVQGPYDVIIVGGGLAGLTAANTLAKNNHKVLILESHNKLGGFATWFFRQGGHTFDVSLHGFPVGMIKTCRKYWNQEIANTIVRLQKIRFINPQFQLETDFSRNDYSRILHEHFGVDKDVVEKFFHHLASMNFYDDHSMTTRELFEQYFAGRNDIFRFLLEPICYANGSTLDDPAITFGIVFSNFMKDGVYTFQGGTDQLIKKMKEELLQNGVDIKLQSKVDKIVVEKDQSGHSRVCGIMLKDQFIAGTSVISNGNLLSTIFGLVGEEHFSPAYIDESKKVRLNNSSCQVYMGIRKGEEIPHVGDLIFTSTSKEFDTERLLDKNISGRTFSFYYPDTRPGQNRYAIVSSTNAHYADWAGLSEEEYERSKEEMIEDTLKGLEEILPPGLNIREKIDFIEAATPLTVERFTLHRQGASFGTKFEGLAVGQKMPHEIKGLFHSGSVGIIMSGWLGAANYGVIVSNEVDRYLMNVH